MLVANAVYQLDQAVARIREFAETNGETLVVVTADHECGGLTLTAAGAEGMTAHFSTEDHTGAPVPLFALGPGAEHFAGSLDNTDIHRTLMELLIEPDPDTTAGHP